MASACACKYQGILTLLYIWVVTSVSIFVAVIHSWIVGADKTVRKTSDGRRKRTVAFFHPYCNSGGGRERVLWAALRALQQNYSADTHHFVIFTGDVGATPDEILSRARNNYNILIDSSNIELVYLTRRKWVEENRYPVFSLVGESLGSLYLGLEALSLFKPDVFLDTMGYAFTLPLFKYLGGSRVAAYVHFPAIATDAIENTGQDDNSPMFLYFKLFAWIYAKAGRCSEVTMVNSSWTEGHILKFWQNPGSTYKVYPPCDVKELQRLKRHDEDQDQRTINLLSVGQFRPEKGHALQVKAMQELKKILKPELWSKVRLVLLGQIPNEEGQKMVDGLRTLAKELEVDGNVVLQTNFSFDILKEELPKGLIGMHSMEEEHFGISVVECMAGGLLMLAHKSGGPLMDIVVESPENERNGFLAQTEQEYAQQIKRILELSFQEQQEIRYKGRSSVNRFSDDEFARNFQQALQSVIAQ